MRGCSAPRSPGIVPGMAPVPPAESMLLPHGPVPVAWRRSARARKVSLRIDPRAGGVVVTLPARAAISAGRALLLAHAGWVAERLGRLPAAMAFVDGGAMTLDGAAIAIRHVPGQRGAAVVDGELRVGGLPEFVGRRVTDFLRGEARRRLGALALAKAATAGLRVRRIVVKDTRSRWGSCTADGTVMVSWRLLLAPPFVQDYVVGHEVAHLRHMNHGREFWALADTLTGHRATATAWLGAHGAGLMRAG